MPNANMSANPAKARAVIEYVGRPENAGKGHKQIAQEMGINESYVRRAKAVFRWGYTMKISPKKLRMDGGTQSREKIDDALVAEYSASMEAGHIFPPPAVFYDGQEYWVADGFHRVLAALMAKLKQIDVEVHMGDVREAILFSVGANATHGKRRKPEDTRRAILKLCNDPEWGQWNNGKIADRCGVSDETVRRIRPEAILHIVEDSSTRKVERNGTVYDQKIPTNGRKPASNGLKSSYGPEDSQVSPEDESQDDEQAIKAGIEPDPDPETNGPIDPPDIARAKAKGIIPADSVVTVTHVGEPETDDRDEPAEGVQAEQTDAEYLAACPVRDKLSESCRKKFDEDALDYRDASEARSIARDAFREAFKAGGRRVNRAYKSAVDRLLRYRDPRHWELCGDCSGTGNVIVVGKCPGCRSRGYMP